MEKGGLGRGERGGRKREKKEHARACSEEVVELLEKRGEEKPRGEGRSATEDDEYNKRTRG